MNTISIDLGGTRVKLGVVSEGRVVESARLASNSQNGFQPLMPELERICKAWQEQYEISRMGIAFPSLVDLEGWVKASFSLPMVLENDANAAALGELGYGAARDTENFVLMILGTGIGTAAVMDGRLLRGKHYQAGVLFGHIPLQRNGRPCEGCHGVGCAEAQASTWALKHMVAEAALESPLKREPTMNFEVLQRHYRAGDRLAKEIFEECCEYWSSCLIALIHAYDPEVAVLSGCVLNWGPELTERIIQTVEQRVWTPWGKLRFRTAEAPERSVLLGLHYLNEKQAEKEKKAL